MRKIFTLLAVHPYSIYARKNPQSTQPHSAPRTVWSQAYRCQNTITSNNVAASLAQHPLKRSMLGRVVQRGELRIKWMRVVWVFSTHRSSVGVQVKYFYSSVGFVNVRVFLSFPLSSSIHNYYTFGNRFHVVYLRQSLATRCHAAESRRRDIFIACIAANRQALIYVETWAQKPP